MSQQKMVGPSVVLFLLVSRYIASAIPLISK